MSTKTQKTPDALQCAEGQNETHVAADSEEETMPIVPCPPWCVTDHEPQPNYHSTAITTIEALDADLTVQLTYDDAADPEPLVELHVGHTVLMTSSNARQLMGALERLVGVERVAVDG